MISVPSSSVIFLFEITGGELSRYARLRVTLLVAFTLSLSSIISNPAANETDMFNELGLL